MRAGLLVDNITFVYSDGSRSVHGGEGGNRCVPFVVRKGQELDEITFRKGDALDMGKVTAQGSANIVTCTRHPRTQPAAPV